MYYFVTGASSALLVPILLVLVLLYFSFITGVSSALLGTWRYGVRCVGRLSDALRVH